MEKLFKTRINYENDGEQLNTSSNESEFSTDIEEDETNYQISNNENKYFPKRLPTQDGLKTMQLKRKRIASTSSNEDRQKLTLKLPTRRPDPKVCNRNALLARENRKRKKEMMTQLETNYNKIQSENKNLKRILKQQNNVIQKLNNEQLYLRSVISNRTEILTLLKTVSSSRLPITSSGLNLKINNSTIKDYEDQHTSHFGTDDDPLLSQSALNINAEHKFLFTDPSQIGNMTPESSGGLSDDICNINGWDSLLNYDNISEIPILKDEGVVKTSSSISSVVSEHNYYTDSDKIHKLSEPGVCFHISSGRVSLEFCSTCHNKAQSAWLEE